MSTKIIRYYAEIKGAPKVISEMRKMRDTNYGLGKANQYVTKTSKINDNQIMTTTGRYDKFGKKIHFVSSEVKHTSSAFMRAHPILGQYVKALARVAIVVPMWMAARMVIQAFTATIRNSFKAMIELSSGLGRAQAVARGSAEEIKAAMTILKHESIEFARTNKGTEKDVTEAFYRMATAGINVKTSLAASIPVAKLANATYADVAQTGKTVAGIYKTLGDSIVGTTNEEEKMQIITDVLATAWSNHRIELNEVERALANVAAQSKRFGLTMQETIAVISISSDNLIASGRAGRLFSRVLDDMMNKLPEVQRLLGRTFDKNVKIKWLDVLKEVLGKINELGAGTVQAEEALGNIFNIRAKRQAGVFLHDMDDIVKAVDKFTTQSKGMTQSLIDIRNATPEAQLEMLGSNITVLARNLATGAMGASSFVEALISINTHLKEISTNALIAGTNMNQMGINIKAIPKLIGAWAGSFAAVTDEIIKGNISIEQGDQIMLQAIDEALSGVKGLHQAEVDALVKFKQEIIAASNQMKLFKDIQEKLAAASKKNSIVPTEADMNRSLKILKAYGASEETIAQERIKYLTKTLKYGEKDEKVLEAKIKLLEVQQGIIKKNASIIEGISKTSFKGLFETGDFSSFFDTFREGVRNSILDAMAEGATNLLFDLTGLSDIMGEGLHALKFEQALESGSVKGSQMFYDKITSAAQQINVADKTGGLGRISSKYGDFATVKDPKTGLHKTIPIAPADYNQQGTGGAGTMENWFGAGGNMWKLAGFGMMGASLFGGGSKSSSSHRYSTAPGARTTSATTRSTVKAVVTNISLNTTFNLDGMSIDNKNLVKEVEGKLTPLIKDITARILENESISSGNI